MEIFGRTETVLVMNETVQRVTFVKVEICRVTTGSVEFFRVANVRRKLRTKLELFEGEG